MGHVEDFNCLIRAYRCMSHSRRIAAYTIRPSYNRQSAYTLQVLYVLYFDKSIRLTDGSKPFGDQLSLNHFDSMQL
jgi:hypothetical protein